MGSSDQGTAQEAALAAELWTVQGTAQEAALETAQRTTPREDETANLSQKNNSCGSGMGKHYKIKRIIQEVEVEEEEKQKGSNHGDAGRNQALHVHPSLAEVEEAGDAIPDGGGASMFPGTVGSGISSWSSFEVIDGLPWVTSSDDGSCGEILQRKNSQRAGRR